MKQRRRGPRPNAPSERHRRKLARFKGTSPTSGHEVAINLGGDVGFEDDAADVRTALHRLPGLYAWYRQVRDRAAAELNAALYLEYCTEEDLLSEMPRPERGKITDAKNELKRHPKMRAAYEVRMAAEAKLADAETAVKSMDEKRSALRMWVDLRIAEMRKEPD